MGAPGDGGGWFGPSGSPSAQAREIAQSLAEAAGNESTLDAAEGLRLGAESFFEAAEVLQEMRL